MFKKPNCPVIAVEEHYWDKEMSATYVGLEASRPGPQSERLFDLGALRLKEMDACGIDMQVISHGAPSAQKLPQNGAAELVRGVNDRLAAACAANPKRFAAFAALPTSDPKAAADELERCVTKHGFKGEVLPVNPGRAEIFGLKAYKDIGAIEGAVDHAYILLNGQQAVDALRVCGQRGVKVASILAGGFADAGAAGASTGEGMPGRTTGGRRVSWSAGFSSRKPRLRAKRTTSCTARKKAS